MVSFDITHEASNLLKLLYALYLSRRKEGKGRVESNYFSSAEAIHQEYLPKMRLCDVIKLCFELESAGCINGQNADNSIFRISLTDKALVYCETTFTRDATALGKWMLEIAGALPF